MADSTEALRTIVASLAATNGVHAHLCEGDPRAAVVWSDLSQITVRLQIASDEEIWVIAGSGLLAREIADSEGGFEVEPFVAAILEGRGVEFFGPASDREELAPRGWRVQTAAGGLFASGLDANDPVVAAALTGPFNDRLSLN